MERYNKEINRHLRALTYINLDIRILHTLMYQVDLCYTDMYLDNGFDDVERSDIGVNIPLSRLSMLPNRYADIFNLSNSLYEW